MSYFYEVVEKFGLPKVAKTIGVAESTAKLWITNNEIPLQYKSDLERMLNKPVSVYDKDQYFTNVAVAQYCWEQLKDIAKILEINLDEYQFIEPSAGTGNFLQCLPHGSIGLDLIPRLPSIHQCDFLTWKPPSSRQKYILIGNPPFGLRGSLALKFIRHAYSFADVVAFILPQLFASDGKGATAKRVRGYSLAHSESLSSNSFHLLNGEDVNVYTVFQIWTKINTHKIVLSLPKTCAGYIKVYSLSDGGTSASTRNKHMIDSCDVYLPSTCFYGKMKAYDSFYDLPNQRGYGVVIHREKNKIKQVLISTDWQKIAFRSTNSALNLRMSLIQNIVIDSGFID